MKGQIAVATGVSLLSAVGAFTAMPSVEGCPFVRNGNLMAPSTERKTVPITPKRTMTLEEAIELGLVQAPAKRRAK